MSEEVEDKSAGEVLEVYVSGTKVLETSDRELVWQRIMQSWAPYEVLRQDGTYDPEFLPY